MWSDPRLIKLAEQFVPAADEVWRLQRGSDPDCRCFQAMADAGHYRSEGGTRQGIYVCSASGKLLASINSVRADAVLARLEQGLKAWREMPEAQRGLRDGAGIESYHRRESSYPENGLVLCTFCRDLPAAGGCESTRAERWNGDHAWFTKREARGWLPPDPQVGDAHEIPKLLFQRLVRFHLIDTVNGQALPFAAEHVAGSLKVEVIERSGAAVRIRLTGKTHASAGGPWLMGQNDWKPSRDFQYAVHTHLLGYASYDLDRGMFTEFEMVALGEWRGFTENNARSKGPQSGPIGFVFKLAPPEASHRVSPAFIDVYNAEWIVKPGRP